ncbi:MAG TPA: bifunctional precorrin-2 dehydrogenase/sirohydrochlorin ferrochelatase [Chloroflexota bacterium]|nr:bifunctional precorrin-2 dehydrogenase/sirohydrochlorin ferrochelatase [Chloroflexota bacterium]HUM67479.1 bifunctional precorrin-2 dehydrogenase/sirohydrochlorin ferrochelatase [Chloroflexota bacterium]
MKPYPLFLIGLQDRHCVMIGGGHEAEHKVAGLLEVAAAVTVIAPELTPTLAQWADDGRFVWLDRDYEVGDLKGAFLVIAERAGVERNTAIYEEAEAERALVNVMDDVAHCNVVAGSVVRQGPLVISISTSGAAPALAVRLREEFEGRFDPAYGTFLAWMEGLRPFIAATHPQFSERKRRWYELVDSEVLVLIRDGREAEARQLIAEIMGVEVRG